MSNDLDPINDAPVTESDIDESRRRLFGKGAAVAAVAAVAGLASSSKANAANGDTVFIGDTTSGTATTLFNGGTTLRVDHGTSSGQASIYGVQGSSSGRSGVRGDSSVTLGRGVYGRATATDGSGVYGEFDGGTVPGTGVSGVSDNGIGVRGNGTTYDLFAGGVGRIGLVQSTVTTSTSGSIGTIARDADGVLWYCYAANKWQRIGGAALAGGFTPIVPVRVFDSRNAAFPDAGSFTASSNRVIGVKDGRDQDTGAVTTANAVPAGATAVTFNVTATNTVGGNFLAVVPGDVVSIDVSTLNWSTTGVSIANASVSKLDDSRQLRIIGGPGGSFDCIVDITGYYL
jgi:hypothetical protein